MPYQEVLHLDKEDKTNKIKFNDYALELEQNLEQFKKIRGGVLHYFSIKI